MRDEDDRVLSLSQAAGLIYGTSEPTPAQILRIKQHLQSGMLEGTRGDGPHAHWTTTTRSVAEYMAAKTYRKQRSSARAHEKPELRTTYQHLLADYFRAVIFRKRAEGASRRFRRAVVAGQVGLLAALMAAVVLGVRPMVAFMPAERAAVVKWLDQNAPGSQVLRWFPPEDHPDGPGRVLRVQYRYQTSRGRTVHTDRRFVIREGRVIGVESDW